MSSLRNVLLFFVVILTLSFTISNKMTKSFEKSTISKGNLSPNFSFENTERTVINLNTLKGKYVYINFWATSSEPSKEELPYFNKLVAEFDDKVTFVNISVDYKRDIDDWKTFVKDQRLKGIQVIASNDWSSDFIKSYDIVKIPRAILIDPNGKIVNAYAEEPSEASDILKVL